MLASIPFIGLKIHYKAVVYAFAHLELLEDMT